MDLISINHLHFLFIWEKISVEILQKYLLCDCEKQIMQSLSNMRVGKCCTHGVTLFSEYGERNEIWIKNSSCGSADLWNDGKPHMGHIRDDVTVLWRDLSMLEELTQILLWHTYRPTHSQPGIIIHDYTHYYRVWTAL